jgi:putative transposase
MVQTLQVSYQISQRRACAVLKSSRSSVRYASVADPQDALRMRLRDLAGVRVGWGYRRLHILLQREGWRVNHKRVWRLYAQAGLAMRRKPPRRRVSCLKRQLRPTAAARNECWSMDFMADQLYDGRRIRVLTLVDNHTRESLALHVGRQIRGIEVVEVLERVVREQGAPGTIRVDNGPEFICKELDLWAYGNKVQLDFSRPGKPTDNAFIEAFNARLRAECLNQHWFLSLDDAREKIEAWRWHYNHQRPHGALGNATPAQFARRAASPGSPLRSEPGDAAPTTRGRQQNTNP